MKFCVKYYWNMQLCRYISLYMYVFFSRARTWKVGFMANTLKIWLPNPTLKTETETAVEITKLCPRRPCVDLTRWRLVMLIYISGLGQHFCQKRIIKCDLQNVGYFVPWWRHKMETFSALLAFCAGNLLVTMASDAELWCFLWSVNNRYAGDSRRHRAHYDVTLMQTLLYYLPYHMPKSYTL